MHEEALMRDLRRKVEELSRGAGGAAILRASVALGPLAHVDEPRLRQLWARAMAGGPAEAAVLEVELLPSPTDPRAASLLLRTVTFGPAAVRPSPPSSVRDG